MSSEQPSPEELSAADQGRRRAASDRRDADQPRRPRLTVPEEKDVDQGRQAIEAARALLPLCPQEEIGADP